MYFKFSPFIAFEKSAISIPSGTVQDILFIVYSSTWFVMELFSRLVFIKVTISLHKYLFSHIRSETISILRSDRFFYAHKRCAFDSYVFYIESFAL